MIGDFGGSAVVSKQKASSELVVIEPKDGQKFKKSIVTVRGSYIKGAVVQVNGKVRDRIQVSASIGEGEAKSAALASEAVQKYLQGKEPRKVILVPGRLVNIVV